MIKNISNLQMSTFLSSLGLATSKTTPPASTGNTADKTKFDSYIRTAQDSLVDPTYSTKQTDDGIAPEDRKYMSIALLSDGSYLMYPPENAPLETKKAWSEAMKQLSPTELMLAKEEVLNYAMDLNPNAPQNAISGLTSYKKIFLDYKKAMEEQLKTESSKYRDAILTGIKVNDIILDTFTKHNIA